MPATHESAVRQIDPNHLDKSEMNILADFLKTTDLRYIEKKLIYWAGAPSVQFQLINPLIFAATSNEQDKKFYIIGTGETATLGKGSFSRTRAITSSLELTAAGDLHYAVVRDKCVRVKNTQAAQSKRIGVYNPGQTNLLFSQNRSYRHHEAQNDFALAQKFPHLSMEAPIEVKKNKTIDSHGRTLGGEFTKSYAVMNLLPGVTLDDSDDTIKDAIINEVSMKELLDNFLIPLVQTYKTQIADHGYAHRDLKPENILIALPSNLKTQKARFNYIDFDSCKKIGERDTAFGTPGFMPPEVVNEHNLTREARDIFALGAILLQAINPALDVQTLVAELAAKAASPNPNLAFYAFLRQNNGCYKIAAAIEQADDVESNLNGFFCYLLDALPLPAAEQQDLIRLIERMTNVDPVLRPSLDETLQQLHTISQQIDQHYKNPKKVKNVGWISAQRVIHRNGM